MAVNRLVVNTCAVSTSGTNCKKAEAASPQFTSNTFDDCNTARSVSSLAVTTGVTLQGAVLMLHRTGTTGTFTVQLQENGVDVTIANGFGVNANVTFNASTIDSKDSSAYYVFGSGYVALVGKTYGIKVTASLASNVGWIRNSGAGTYSYALIGNGDDTTGITSGDTLWIANTITVTQDASVTVAVTGSFCMVMGDGATWKATANSIAFNYTGNIFIPSNCTFQMGTSALSPISGLTWAHTGGGGTFIAQSNGSTSDYRQQILFYGKTYADMSLLCNSAAASQNVVNLQVNVPATWADGDVVEFYGKGNAAADTVTYFMKKTGAAQISLFTTAGLSVAKNLDFLLVAGGAVANTTQAAAQLGITMTDTVSFSSGILNGQNYGNFVLNGVFSTSLRATMGTANGTTASTADSVYCGVADSNGFATLIFTSAAAAGTFNNIIARNNGGVVTPFPTFTGNGNTVTKFRAKNFGQSDYNQSNWNTGNALPDANQVFSDWVIASVGSNGRFTSGHFQGVNLNATNITCIGVNVTFSCFSSTFTNCSATYGNTNVTIVSSANLTFVNSTFGTGSTSGTNDITFYNKSDVQVLFNNCTIGTKGFGAYDNILQTNITYQAAITSDSYLQWHSYNATLGDNRTFKKYGTIVTDASAYTDMNMTNSSTATLEADLTYLSQTISSDLLYFAITGQINNAAYYGGSFVLPKVDIYMDSHATTGTADATAALIASTASQPVQTSFTPTTNNNQVALAFRTNTDQTGTNAQVTWSGASFISRVIGYKFASTSVPINETLTYPIGTLTAKAADPFWSVTNAVTLAGYSSLFTINLATNSVTVIANATVQQLYDYYHYLLTLSANVTVAEKFTTSDGNKFTSTLDLTINTGVTLSGNAGQTISMAANTLTLTGTGTTSGVIVTDVAGTHAPVTVTGMIAGSTLYIHNSTDSTTIVKAVEAGTSYTTLVTISGSKTLDVIRVRNPNYLPYETSGTLTINGFSLVVSQVASSIYSQTGVDGSIITDFSFTGSTIKIFSAVGSSTVQELIAWYLYTISTTSYIDLQPNDIATPSSQYAQLLNNTGTQLQLKNTNLTPLVITGGNITDGSNNASNAIDLTGGPIFIVSSEPASNPTDMAAAVWADAATYTTGTKGANLDIPVSAARNASL